MWRVYLLRAHYRAQSGSHVQNSARCSARAIKTKHDAKNRIFMRLWRSVDFHSISSRAKMKYKTLFTLFFSFPAVENNICNGKSGYPFGDFTLFHFFVEIS